MNKLPEGVTIADGPVGAYDPKLRSTVVRCQCGRRISANKSGSLCLACKQEAELKGE